jgi:hypothetical protein
VVEIHRFLAALHLGMLIKPRAPNQILLYRSGIAGRLTEDRFGANLFEENGQLPAGKKNLKRGCSRIWCVFMSVKTSFAPVRFATATPQAELPLSLPEEHQRD